MGQVGESNFRDELEEVWVPKDVGELEGLLPTIQNEPGKKILKHKIQQMIEVYRAKLIVEGANGPTTPEAEAELYRRGSIVVPDISANAGGVVMSYLEWVENLQWYWWDEEETLKRLDAIMTSNVKRLIDRYESLKSTNPSATMRDAAFILALERIYRAMKARGWL